MYIDIVYLPDMGQYEMKWYNTVLCHVFKTLILEDIMSNNISTIDEVIHMLTSRITTNVSDVMETSPHYPVDIETFLEMFIVGLKDCWILSHIQVTLTLKSAVYSAYSWLDEGFGGAGMFEYECRKLVTIMELLEGDFSEYVIMPHDYISFEPIMSRLVRRDGGETWISASI